MSGLPSLERSPLWGLPALTRPCSPPQDEDKFQFGKTKIFFRAGQVAYLEKLRSDKMRRSMVLIQAHVRGFLHARRYKKLRASALGIQAYGRGFLSRKLARSLKEAAAATLIQARVRGWLGRLNYHKALRAIRTVQRFARGASAALVMAWGMGTATFRGVAVAERGRETERESERKENETKCWPRHWPQCRCSRLPASSPRVSGMFGRRLYAEKKREHAAQVIQSTFRMAKNLREFLRVRAAVIILQCGTRRVLAKRRLKQLKTDARSVEGIKARNTGLEKKIMELQQTMDRRVKAAKEEQVRLESGRDDGDWNRTKKTRFSMDV